MKLLLLGRSSQRRGVVFTTCDHLRDIIKVSGADFALVLRCGVAFGFGRKLFFLQFGVCRHPVIAISVRELKHAVVESVEPGQSNELKLVTHRAELALKFRDRRAIELLPIE